MNKSRSRISALRRTAIASSLIALGLCAAPALVHAQTATIYGSLSNFDVVNNTGEDACGFQAEIEGLPPGYPVSYFSAQRYGVPVIEDYISASGQSGRRMSYKSSDCSVSKTVAHPPGTPFGGSCYSWNVATYQNAGCEHFGVRYYFAGSTTVTYRWLVNDAVNPGSYVPHDPPIQIGTPTYYIQPAVAVGPAAIPPPPVVVAVVPAPPPPPARFGEPHWMKTFVRQLPREVTLDELITENPTTVPMDPALIETNWELLQADPPGSGGNRRGRGQSSKGKSLDPTTRTVARRYETYAYTGPRDALTNEALCADLLCNAPSADELGDFISANMTAVHVQGDFITVAKAGIGGGLVESTDKRLSCGNKCVSPYTAGSQVTLTAKANSGSVFAGWSGVCAGTANCTVTINGANEAIATFNTAPAGGGGGGGGGGGTVTPPSSFQLKVSSSNSGTVTSDVGSINCGLACTATVAPGTAVTLIATPPAGKTFSAWSGACTGTTPTCTVTVNANLSVKANFNK
jgi:uncharacterized repeat protein (TIGR02543 family)